MAAPPEPPAEPRLLARDYWLVQSTPRPGVTAEDVAARADEHVAWLLGLERDGVLLMSGPLTSGDGVRPGSGVTVLRAAGAEEALALARQDPFVLAGLRDPAVFGWRVNEGSVGVTVSLGTGRFHWT